MVLVTVLQDIPLGFLGIFILFVYYLSVYVWRLYFSPLAGFPGPKSAACTHAYEFYWNVIKPGKLTHHLQTLHKQYGPIIRISPTELHISDAVYFDSIYCHQKRDKYPAHVKWAGTTTSAHSTVGYREHRVRRAAQDPFFSKKRVLAFAPLIQEYADKLVDRISTEYGRQDKPLRLDDAYGCLTGDIIMQFCFGKHYDFLGCPNFSSPFLGALQSLEHTYHIMTLCPWLTPIATAIPERFLPSGIRSVKRFERDISKQIQDATDSIGNDRGNDDHLPNIFKELLRSDLPPTEKGFRRLRDEGITLVGAGQETVKIALQVGTFYLLQQAESWNKLRQEVLSVYRDPHHPPTLPILERLPYLTAVIYEALRLSYGVVARLPRVAHEDLEYGPYTIPAGTPVSMTFYSMHHNEMIFPDSHKFFPERWLSKSGVPVLNTYTSTQPTSQIEALNDNHPLTRYLVSFGKGSRRCLGQKLALAELYIIFATVVRRLRLEMVDTELEDVGFVRDMFVPHPRDNSQGLQVMVKRGVRQPPEDLPRRRK